MKPIEELLQKKNLFINIKVILELLKTENEKMGKILLNNNYTGNLTLESITFATAINQINNFALIKLLLEQNCNKAALTKDLVIAKKYNFVSGKSFI